ncbi:MAG: PKD domain-containing protein [Phycisphaerae bacterium]
MIILHEDVGDNPEAVPVHQRRPPFGYTIVQADGLDELGAAYPPGDRAVCDDLADAGDVWPGSTNNTTFTCDTVPASRWNSGNACTGLNISDIVLDGRGGAMVTMTWIPQEIPGLQFRDPPGGVSVRLSGNEVIYNIRAEVTDLFGGSWLRYFYVKDGEPFTIKSDGSNFIGMAKKLSPGRTDVTVGWNISGIPDGRYRIFAELIPAEGADDTEAAFSMPRAGRNNVGQGTLTVDRVNTSEVRGFGTSGQFSGSTFTATDDAGAPVVFSSVQVGDQLTVEDASRHKTALRGVVGLVPDASGNITALRLSSGVTSPFSVSSWLVVRGGSTARSETWTLRLARIDSGTQKWDVFSTLTQPAPNTGTGGPNPWKILEVATNSTTNTGANSYKSANDAVEFTVTNKDVLFAVGDTWSFTTTGITALSATTTIDKGQINEAPIAVITATPLSGDPPLTVKFDGRGSFDPNGAALDYLWDFGDGTPPSAGPLQTHVYRTARTFTARLTVTNTSLGLFGEASVDIVVKNNSPKARFSASPMSGGETDLNVSFDASESSDTETRADDLVYQWDFGDGAGANATGTPGALVTTEHLFVMDSRFPCVRDNQKIKDQIGAAALAEALKKVACYTVTLTVTDQGDKSSTASVDIEVGNTRPVPGVTPALARVPVGSDATFSAIGSFDPDAGDRLWVLWDWGDGSPIEGPYPLTGPPGSTDGRVRHAYLEGGTYTPRATVFDSTGAISVWTGNVIVSDEAVDESAPKADFRVLAALPLIVDVPFEVDASRSFDRPEGAPIVQYRWDWGDGSDEAIGRKATHTYTEVGDYEITLLVFDGENPPNTGEMKRMVQVREDSEPLPVENSPPGALFDVNLRTGMVGDEFVFDAGRSFDPDGDALSFKWDFGDRTSGVGIIGRHVYTTSGTFNVRLTVTDTHGAASVSNQTVVVTARILNRAPIVWIGTGPRSGTAPMIIRFDGSNSRDPDGDDVPLTYAWYVDDVLVGTEAILVYTFTEPGTYGVRLEVSDGQSVGRSDVETVVVTTRMAPFEIEPGQDVPSDDTGGGTGRGTGTQRGSGLLCGLGMVMSLAGSLLGLFVMMVARRRFPL